MFFFNFDAFILGVVFIRSIIDWSVLVPYSPECRIHDASSDASLTSQNYFIFFRILHPSHLFNHSNHIFLFLEAKVAVQYICQRQTPRSGDVPPEIVLMHPCIQKRKMIILIPFRLIFLYDLFYLLKFSDFRFVFFVNKVTLPRRCSTLFLKSTLFLSAFNGSSFFEPLVKGAI